MPLDVTVLSVQSSSLGDELSQSSYDPAPNMKLVRVFVKVVNNNYLLARW